MTNRDFMKDGNFIKCCEEADISVTKRQASKFIMKKGKAYNIGLPKLKEKQREQNKKK